MRKTKTPTMKAEEPEQKPVTQLYYFPSLGKTVEATSWETAERLVRMTKLKKGSAQEDGDGNIQ